MTRPTGGKIGRPKKDSTIGSLKELIEDMASKKDKSGRTYHQAIVRQLLKTAAGGTQWAILEYFNRIAGKSINLQQTDITSGGESLSASVNFVGNTLNSGAEQPLKAIDPIVDQVVDVTKESTSD